MSEFRSVFLVFSLCLFAAVGQAQTGEEVPNRLLVDAITGANAAADPLYKRRLLAAILEEYPESAAARSISAGVVSFPGLPDRPDWQRLLVADSVVTGYRHGQFPSLGQATHPGFDIGLPGQADCGRPVTAPLQGSVVRIVAADVPKDELMRTGISQAQNDRDLNPESGIGNAIILRHGEGSQAVYTIYLHLEDSPKDEAGNPWRVDMIVPAGAPIGQVGQTGAAVGCHLHFEARRFEGRFRYIHPDFDDLYPKGDVSESLLFARDWIDPEAFLRRAFIARHMQTEAENPLPPNLVSREAPQSQVPDTDPVAVDAEPTAQVPAAAAENAHGWLETMEPRRKISPGETAGDIAVAPDGSATYRGDVLFPAAQDPPATELWLYLSPKARHGLVMQWDLDIGGRRAALIDLAGRRITQRDIIADSVRRTGANPQADRIVTGPVFWSGDELYLAFALSGSEWQADPVFVDLSTGVSTTILAENLQPGQWTFPKLETVRSDGPGNVALAYDVLKCSDANCSTPEIVGLVEGAHQIAPMRAEDVSPQTATTTATVGAPQEWGEGLVAGVEVGYAPCRDAARDSEACLRAIGLSEQAVAFSFAVDGDYSGSSVGTQFRELGAVDLAVSEFIGNTSYFTPVLLNGPAGFQPVTLTQDLEGSFQDGTSQDMLRRFPKATNVGGAEIISHRKLADGTQRFTLAEKVSDGCRACDVLGVAISYLELGPATANRLTRRPVGLYLDDRGDGQEMTAALIAARPQMLQVALNVLGYDAGEMDGYPGPMTRQALMEFQAAHCLAPTGYPDPSTVDALAAADGFEAPCADARLPDGLDANSPLLSGVYVDDPALCRGPTVPFETVHLQQRIVRGNRITWGQEGVCETRRTDIRDGATLFRGTCSEENSQSDARWRFDLRSNESFVDLDMLTALPQDAAPRLFTRCRDDSQLRRAMVSWFGDAPGTTQSVTQQQSAQTSTTEDTAARAGPWRYRTEPDLSLRAGETGRGFSVTADGAALYQGMPLFQDYRASEPDFQRLVVFISGTETHAVALFMRDGAERIALVDLENGRALNSSPLPFWRYGPGEEVTWGPGGEFVALSVPMAEFSTGLGFFELATGKYTLLPDREFDANMRDRWLPKSLTTLPDGTISVSVATVASDMQGAAQTAQAATSETRLYDLRSVFAKLATPASAAETVQAGAALPSENGSNDALVEFPDLRETIDGLDYGGAAEKAALKELFQTALYFVGKLEPDGTAKQLGINATDFASYFATDPGAMLAVIGTDVAISAGEAVVAEAAGDLVAGYMFASGPLSQLPDAWQVPLRAFVDATIVESVGLLAAGTDPTGASFVGPIMDRLYDVYEIYMATNALSRTQASGLFAVANGADITANLVLNYPGARSEGLRTDWFARTRESLRDMVGPDDADAVYNVTVLGYRALEQLGRGERDAASAEVERMRAVGNAAQGLTPLSAEGPIDLLVRLASSGNDAPNVLVEMFLKSTALKDLHPELETQAGVGAETGIPQDWQSLPEVAEQLRQLEQTFPQQALDGCARAHGPITSEFRRDLFDNVLMTVADQRGRMSEHPITRELIEGDQFCLNPNRARCVASSYHLYYCASREFLFVNAASGFGSDFYVTAVTERPQNQLVAGRLSSEIYGADMPDIRSEGTVCALSNGWSEATSFRWNGQCANGRATGPGVIEWMRGPEVIWRTRVGPSWDIELSDGTLRYDIDLESFDFSLVSCDRSGSGLRAVDISVPTGKMKSYFENSWIVEQLMNRGAIFAQAECPVDDKRFSNIIVGISLDGEQIVRGRNYEQNALSWREFSNPAVNAMENELRQAERNRVATERQRAAQARAAVLANEFQRRRDTIVARAEDFIATGQGGIDDLAAALELDHIGTLGRLEKGFSLSFTPVEELETTSHDGKRHYRVGQATSSPFARLEREYRSKQDFSWENWMELTQSASPDRTEISCLFARIDAVPREVRDVDMELLSFSRGTRATRISALCD